MQDMKRRAVRGIIAKLCGQGLDFVVRIISLVILARLLSPQDFGLVAMVTAFTSLYGVFMAGFSMATIQKASITNEQLSTLFWVGMLSGTVLALLCAIAAPVLATFYGDQRLFWVTVTIAGGFVFSAAELQHSAILQRQLRFATLAAIEALRLAVSTGVAVGMALAGFQYWALVASLVVAPLVGVVCLWTSTRWIPARPRRVTEIRSMLHFGGIITLNNFIVYVAYNFEKILLGRFWGAQDLGLYGRAYQLTTIPTVSLNSAVGGVVFSSLSRLHDDPVRRRSYFLKAYEFVNSLTIPVTVFCALFAGEIVSVALGPQWMDSTPIFRLLAPTVMIFGIINPMGWLLQSTGLQKRSLKIAFVIAPLIVTAYLIGLPFGPNGVASAYSAAMTLWLIPHVLWCLKGTSISPADIFWATCKPFFSASVAAAFSFVVLLYVGNGMSPLSRLAIGGGAMSATYLAILFLIQRKNSLYLEFLEALGAEPRSV
jgi:O-antigen/teichoic acid export membrane protein